MADRKPISMSALTAGLESARGRGTASDRENLMEGRTYIPRMSKEQKALLISALQAGAKKRREKRDEKESEKMASELERQNQKLLEERKEMKPLPSAQSRSSEIKSRSSETKWLAKRDPSTLPDVSEREVGFDTENYDLELRLSNNAKGGIIPKQKKKRTIKYRR